MLCTESEHNIHIIDPFHCLPEHYRPKCPMSQIDEVAVNGTKGSEASFPTVPTSDVRPMELPRTKCPVSYLRSIPSLQCIMLPSDMLPRLPSTPPLPSKLLRITSEQIRSMTRTIPVSRSVVNLMATILISLYIIITRFYDQQS